MARPRSRQPFDAPNLVSRAALAPVMGMAERAALAGEHVRPGRRCGVNAQVASSPKPGSTSNPTAVDLSP
jgi:hypothetical protein